jgi:hypothetical protein
MNKIGTKRDAVLVVVVMLAVGISIVSMSGISSQ